MGLSGCSGHLGAGRVGEEGAVLVYRREARPGLLGTQPGPGGRRGASTSQPVLLPLLLLGL